jgi:hypothetical protein
MSQPIPDEDVIVWFNVHNMNYEKIEFCGDLFRTLYIIMSDTYLGDDDGETKISLSSEDKNKHFDWCWNKLIELFSKEDIKISSDGDLKSYFNAFFFDTFYDDNQKNIKGAIPSFIEDVFSLDKPFTKSDLEILTETYKMVEKSVSFYLH